MRRHCGHPAFAPHFLARNGVNMNQRSQPGEDKKLLLAPCAEEYTASLKCEQSIAGTEAVQAAIATPQCFAIPSPVQQAGCAACMRLVASDTGVGACITPRQMPTIS